MRKKPNSKVVVLCDFDGTIVDVDTGSILLSRFGKGNWEELDIKLENGLISLEECLVGQFKTVKASKEEILKMIRSERIRLRKNFESFVEYCKKRRFPFIIATGGVDFCITEILNSKGFADSRLRIHSAACEWSNEGLIMTFPKPTEKGSKNFKEDLVNHYHNLGSKVVYIGDGSSDYEPAKKADLVFAVKDSSLARMCKGKGIFYVEFADFSKIMTFLDKKWNQ